MCSKEEETLATCEICNASPEYCHNHELHRSGLIELHSVTLFENNEDFHVWQHENAEQAIKSVDLKDGIIICHHTIAVVHETHKITGE